MEETAKIIRHHPKLLDRWAEQYCKLYLRYGALAAKNWAVDHLTKQDIEVLTPVIVEKFSEMGWKPVS
jgi:hypothetical protein